MAYMETKQYLGQISRLDRMIKNKMSELAQYKELAYGLSAIANEEKVKSSASSFDKIGIKIAKIVEMEEKINNLIDEYVDKKNLIIFQIDNMEDDINYEILYSRYIEKKTFEDIAVKLHYSWRQIIRLHGRALNEFEKKYGSTYL